MFNRLTHQLERHVVPDDVADEQSAEDETVSSEGDCGQPPVVGVEEVTLVIGGVVETGPGQNDHDDVDTLKKLKILLFHAENCSVFFLPRLIKGVQLHSLLGNMQYCLFFNALFT